MDWSEFWDGAVKFITALGVAVVAILQVWQRRTSVNNATEIKETLKAQNVDLETIRVDCETVARAVETQSVPDISLPRNSEKSEQK